MKLPQTLANVKDRPGMYLRVSTFDAAAAFVDGYDAALCGGVLVGLREWLIVRVDGANNLAWSGLILHVLGDPDAQGDQAMLIKGLFNVLEEFMGVRGGTDGLRRIYVSYEKWLRSQEWYTPTSPQWIDC